MNEEEIVKKVRKFAINNSERDDIHGFVHVERVYKTCVKIGKEINANTLVLKIAVLLHDTGRIKEQEVSQGTNHAEISADMARSFLSSKDINLPKEDIENVVHCIKAHSFSNKIIPETIEAKILSDADKLDAIGAIGLYRTIGFTIVQHGGIDQVLEHLKNKIIKLKDQMHFNISKKIAEKRQHIIVEFCKEIRREM